jgi:hypothetical protein
MAAYPMVRGKNQTEKNASIEHILKSLHRRAVKRATVYIPPVPLFMHCEVVGETNIIDEILLPFSGTLKDLFIRIGDMNTVSARIALSVISATGETTQHFVLSKPMERITLEMEVFAGSTLELVLEEGQIGRILVALALYPVIEDHRAKQYLLDEILKEEEPNIAIQDQEDEKGV